MLASRPRPNPDRRRSRQYFIDRSWPMKPLAVAGLLLIVVGIAGLALGRFSYTTEKKVIYLGPITASLDEKHNIDIPDIAGIGAILVGGLPLYLGRKNA
jgi:hypothetical protein